MAKSQSVYACQNCGYHSPKWLGKSPDCKRWNSFAEETFQKTQTAERYSDPSFKTLSSEAIPISQVSTQVVSRISSKNEELERLLGGGIVPGSLTLLGGDPGIGKSTLVLQMLAAVAERGPVLYVSGEESASQIKLRAERLGVKSDQLYVLSENNLRKAIEVIEKINPHLLVVDSIQTVFLPELESAPGSLTQVRECTGKLLYATKSRTMATWLVGHMTKEGMIAGPKVLEHLVDTVLYFEGDKGLSYRLLRTNKNRFGSTNEVGVFEMAASGLIPVSNPSALFLSENTEVAPGSVVVSSLEGTRPFLVEVQVLVTSSNLGNPRRVSLGVDSNRLSILVAILEKTVGLSFAGMDIFLNVVGGLKLSETGCDLGILAALASSHRGKPLKKGTVLIGETGLSGEVRAVGQTDLRLTEIERLGFERVILSSKTPKEKRKSKIETIYVKNVEEALEILL
ncbi:MAG: DNA repair protein RadA [Deltaproteobacteria bacterium]|nr:DNA repair protein RadA [Deltaproteobacteria bacterium]